jgi:group I intron endonuclease
MFYLYIYENLINGMIYIGQTKNLEVRDYRHCHDNDMKIDKAIREFGRENFSLNVIATTDTEDQIVYAEIDWIARARNLLGRNMLYNVSCGGPNGWKGLKHSEESRKKMSRTHEGMHVGNKNNMFGKNHTAKSKELVSKNRKGKSCGETRPNAILTRELVESIRNDSRSERALAKLYGVSRSTINAVKRGTNWK